LERKNIIKEIRGAWHNDAKKTLLQPGKTPDRRWCTLQITIGDFNTWSSKIDEMGKGCKPRDTKIG